MFLLLLVVLSLQEGQSTYVTECISQQFYLYDDHSLQQHSSDSSICLTARGEVCLHTIVHDRNATAPPYLKFTASCAAPPPSTAECTRCHLETALDGYRNPPLRCGTGNTAGRDHDEDVTQLYEYVCCCVGEDGCSTPVLDAAFGRNLSAAHAKLFLSLSQSPPIRVHTSIALWHRIVLFVGYALSASGIQLIAHFMARRAERKQALKLAEDAKKRKKPR